MQLVVDGSQDYPGHDRPWQPPASWTRENQSMLDSAKDMLLAATSTAGNGRHLQLVETAMVASCKLTLTSEGIKYYRQRLVAGKLSTKKSKKPLYVPNIKSPNKPYLRFPHMLPAVACMVINEWDELSGLLHAALAEVPAATSREDTGAARPPRPRLRRSATLPSNGPTSPRTALTPPRRRRPRRRRRRPRQRCVTDFF